MLQELPTWTPPSVALAVEPGKVVGRIVPHEKPDRNVQLGEELGELVRSAALWYIRAWRRHPVLMAGGHAAVLGGVWVGIRYVKHRLPVQDSVGFSGRAARFSGNTREAVDNAGHVAGVLGRFGRRKAGSSHAVSWQQPLYNGEG